MKKYSNLIIAAILAVISFAVCSTHLLYAFDKILSDPLYQHPTSTNPNIRIIAIDEKTLQEYGKTENWSREIPAKLVETLNQSESVHPAVIAFDVMYVSDADPETDEYFAEACGKYNNVVTAVNVVQKTKVSRTESGGMEIDNSHIDLVEYPYKALKEVSDYGFANTLQDSDGYIRYAGTAVEYEGETIESLPLVVYRKYCQAVGAKVQMPKTFSNGIFSFQFSGKSGSYETVSLCDVLEGRIDPKVFNGSIVLMGAYAPGMQDAYNVAVQKGAQMYGVEIHANILEALMEGKTGVAVDARLYALIVMLLTLAFYFVCRKVKIVPEAVLAAVLIAADLLAGVLLYRNGLVVDLIELPVFLILIFAYDLVHGYLAEILRRRKVVNAFKKYVAPQVVDEISKKGDFKLVLGGENRHVAVLFVDIRGFTPMSENLMPEQVVEILNEYLDLTTHAIFQNGGTLDKFIGDATMAVFNAPFDLDDYIYRAVCTARDIAAGSEELHNKLMERFGKSVSFGIGVNCGNAVVGNIGCDFRMDYTAIGDTVNTAARLESNAKRGQILISSDVYEAVKDRVEVTEVGVIPLKGKSNGVFVYQLDKVL